MAREKKDGRHINLYIEREIIESLEKYCERMGQTKTVAIERALNRISLYFQKTRYIIQYIIFLGYFDIPINMNKLKK